MVDRTKYSALGLLFLAAVVFAPSIANADDWQVRKTSGEVWILGAKAQRASLSTPAILRAGETIRTGNTGRVLLVRGKETILVAPNSDITLPSGKTGSLSTTILQQAGSILLDVEKRNVRHFAVETPYLAAVVKGTLFRVTVDSKGADVLVVRGRVHVADFKSGKFALVLPGQTASVDASGKGGLQLHGAGALSPIQQGTPRKARVDYMPVPANGLSAPRKAPPGLHVRALTPAGPKVVKQAGHGHAYGHIRKANGRLRLTAPLGDEKLDVHKATKGLARGKLNKGTESPAATNKRTAKTIWEDGDSNPGIAAGFADGSAGGKGGGKSGGGNSATAGSQGAAMAAAHANGNGKANGNGNGNGNGKAKGKNKI